MIRRIVGRIELGGVERSSGAGRIGEAAWPERISSNTALVRTGSHHACCGYNIGRTRTWRLSDGAANDDVLCPRLASELRGGNTRLIVGLMCASKLDAWSNNQRSGRQ